MAEAKQDQTKGIITTSQAARLLGCSEMWIGKLHKMEYFPKVERGRWNLVQVVQGYIKFLKDDDRRSSKSASASRVQDLRAERMEMEMEEKRRGLVAMEDAQIVIDALAATVSAEFRSIPSQFTRDMEARRRLQDLVDKAMNKVAEEMADKADALRSGEDVTKD